MYEWIDTICDMRQFEAEDRGGGGNGGSVQHSIIWVKVEVHQEMDEKKWRDEIAVCHPDKNMEIGAV